MPAVELHAGTLAVTLVLIAPLLSVANLVLWKQTRERALLWWALGSLTGAGATAADLFFGDAVILPIVFVLGHSLLALGFLLFWAGIRCFQARPLPPDRVPMAFALGVALFAGAMAFGLPKPTGILLASLVIATLSALCAAELLLRHNEIAKGASRFTAGMFIFNALFFAARGIWSLSPGMAVPTGDAMQLATNAEILTLLIGWNFGFLMMTSQRYMGLLADLATHDDLTGILNRRAFYERARHHFQLAERGGPVLTALAMDLDLFKRVNDTYGHAAGDVVLREFVRVAESCLRGPDILARVGGEEFCALLPLTRAVGAVALAERVRQKLAEKPITYRGQPIAVSVSIGVTEFSADTPDLETLLAAADAALYRAKNEGRNRVVMSTPATAPTALTLPVMHLTWDGRYSSGDVAIDAEHENLFSLINVLVGKIQGNHDIRTLHGDLRELLFWLSEHYRHEEDILRAIAWEGLDTHTRQHRALETRGNELLFGVAQGQRGFAEILDYLIRDVVGIHLSQHDLAYFPALAKARAEAGAV